MVSYMYKEKHDELFVQIESERNMKSTWLDREKKHNE